MCRSKINGGRRCPRRAKASQRAESTASPVSRNKKASARTGAKTSARTGAKAAWKEAQRTLDAAKAAVGPVLGNPSYLLIGPLAQQAEHVRGGGDPSVYREQVEQGRKMLISRLADHGDDPDTAAAKVKDLAAAYATWSQTPEA